MVNKNKRTKLPPSLPLQLRNENKIVRWIAEITSEDEFNVRSRLRQEFEKPGVNTAQSFAETGLEPYVWSDGLSRFYEQTDAFIYELVIWNLNRIKCYTRRRVAKYLRRVAKHLVKSKTQGLKILSIGDGLGFDSLYLAQAGHKVTYYDVPGYAHSFASLLFADANAEIAVVDDLASLPAENFDAVLCLDVLEHVPDVPALISRLVDYLRPGGVFIVHSPFYMVHPANPTHLKVNRKYSGSLGLYYRFNLRLVDGIFTWNPLVFEKISDGIVPRCRPAIRILTLYLGIFYLALGRFTNFPFRWVDFYRRKHNKWFD